MRIIAGSWRGRRLVTAAGSTTRPTADRVREAVFSSLTSALGGWEGVRVLDAFAGSGALGLEALSRGAAHAMFFERDRKALDALRSNIERCGAGEHTTVVPRDVLKPGSVTALAEPVSLLLLDPPYRIDKAKVRGLIEALIASEALAEGGLVVWEHASSDAVELPERVRLLGHKEYGSTAIELAVVDADGGDR